MTVAWQPPPGHGIVGCAGQRGPAIEGYLLELDDGCGGEFRVNNKFLDEHRVGGDTKGPAVARANSKFDQEYGAKPNARCNFFSLANNREKCSILRTLLMMRNTEISETLLVLSNL